MRLLGNPFGPVSIVTNTNSLKTRYFFSGDSALAGAGQHIAMPDSHNLGE